MIHLDKSSRGKFSCPPQLLAVVPQHNHTSSVRRPAPFLKKGVTRRAPSLRAVAQRGVGGLLSAATAC